MIIKNGERNGTTKKKPSKSEIYIDYWPKTPSLPPHPPISPAPPRTHTHIVRQNQPAETQFFFSHSYSSPKLKNIAINFGALLRPTQHFVLWILLLCQAPSASNPTIELRAGLVTKGRNAWSFSNMPRSCRRELIAFFETFYPRYPYVEIITHKVTILVLTYQVSIDQILTVVMMMKCLPCKVSSKSNDLNTQWLYLSFQTSKLFSDDELIKS